jgi:hypothetical protein
MCKKFNVKKMKFLSIVFFFFVGLPFLISQTRVINHSTTVSFYNDGIQYTSITTAPNGDIYQAWMDPSNNLKAMRIKVDGGKDSVILRTGMQQDRYHVRPSIAIDKLGYIHIAADMHNDAWVYYRTNSINDILGGFTSITPPGRDITYPNFFKDNNDDLYIAHRHKVKNAPNNFLKGSAAGGILKYDATSQTFTALGAAISGAGFNTDKTVVWVDFGGGSGCSTSSQNSCSYQQPNIRLHFDNTNRMHIVCNLITEINTNTEDGNTHVLYAYSDDGGNTFNKVDGTPISFPLNHTNMSVVAYQPSTSPTADLIVADSRIGAFAPNRPVILWYTNVAKTLTMWNGAAWQTFIPASGFNTFSLVSNRNNETLFFNQFSTNFYTSSNGSSFTRYNLSPTISSPKQVVLDEEYYIKQKNLRFQYNQGSTTTGAIQNMHLSTINFVTLPIELSSFTGKRMNNLNELKWQTTSEKNSGRFDIQRQKQGDLEWQTVGNVAAQGSSATTKDYTFSDNAPLAIGYYYRLKMLDKDATYTFSKTIYLESTLDAEDVLGEDKSITHLYNQKQINITTKPVKLPLRYSISNTIGQIVVTGKVTGEEFSVDVSQLNMGFYIISLTDGRKLKFVQR